MQYSSFISASASCGIDHDNSDDRVGRHDAVAPVYPLGQSEAAAAPPFRPGDDAQPVPLVAGVSKIEVQVHDNGDGPEGQ
jgi:hypothetical protein